MESRTLQHRLPRNRSARANTSIAHSFAKLIFMGKCKAALDLISNMEKRGILNLNDPADCDSPTPPIVRKVLISKHPPAHPAHPNCILHEEPQNTHPVIFESLDASIIRSAALRVTGAAGPSPSGLDAHEWRRLCTSHKGASRDLYASLATIARRFALPMLTHHPSDHYLHVGSLLLINTRECVPLALVTLLIES